MVGRIVGLDGLPEAGLRVWGGGREATTGLDGSFRLEFLPTEEAWTLSATGDSTSTVVHRILLAPNEERGVQLTVAPAELHTLTHASLGGSVVTDGGLVVDFQPGSLRLLDGTPVSGEVTVRTTLLQTGEVMKAGPGAGLPTQPTQIIPSSQAWSALGQSLMSAGDVDGDGDDELIVGEPGWDGLHSDGGVVRLFDGGPSGLITPPLWSLFGSHDQGGLDSPARGSAAGGG